MDGDDVLRLNMVSWHKLIHLMREAAPSIVAVDNIFELAKSRQDLIGLLRRLPAKTLLVQVTGGERQVSLVKLARWHGIQFDRQNPMDEAEACARLAAKGVGMVVSAFEDRTWIKVSRRRSPGRGGWSQNRYSRKIHGSVKGAAREVEAKLKESGLPFSSKAVEGLGGYIRCEFIVEAPREQVHVKPGRYEDAQVRVEGIERPKLQFHPLKSRRGYIIAGIDPGTTTGVAALNLRGEMVDIISARAMSPSDVIEWLADCGKPLIVATDVHPTPGAVEKIKRAFNAVLYSPGEALSAEEKILLARPYGYRNDHERDSLAAAVRAFKRYRNKFAQVEKKVPAEVDPEEVKALLVKGHSIDRAISKLSVSPPPPSEEAPVEETVASVDLSALRSQNRDLAEQVRRLREYVDELGLELEAKDREIEEIARRMERVKDRAFREIKRNQQIKIRDKEIARLRGMLRSERKQLRRLKAQLSRVRKAERIEKMEGYRRLKPVDTFSKEEVAASAKRWSIAEGDIVLLMDASGGGAKASDLLVDIGVDAVIVRGEMPPQTKDYLGDKGVPVITTEEVPLREIDGISFINPPDLEKARSAWEERMKVREAERKAEWLESIFAEYKVERKREQKREEREHQA